MNRAPKGKLIAIGGAEDKGTADAPGHKTLHAFIDDSILRRVVDEAGGSSARIALITAASMIPE